MKVKEAAYILGKDPNWVRMGIIKGWLPIGIATRNGEKVSATETPNGRRGRINYYISEELFNKVVGGKK